MNDKTNSHTSVLIVDDLRSARDLLKDMLAELGFTNVIEAADGREAATLLEKHTVDLVLCDQVMPDMCGKDLLLHIRRNLHNQTLPVIFVSSLGAVTDVEEVLELQANGYLVKPVSLRKLRRTVDEALHPVDERIEL
jgi:two-component system chemotaxis response regulator CheY